MANLSVSINARQYSIISAILESVERITIEELSEATNLSPRMVRYNMSSVKAWFKQNNVDLKTRSGYGLYLDIPSIKKKELLKIVGQMDDYDLILSKDQRIQLVLLHLLIAYEPSSVQQLSDTENISRSTIFKDFQEIQLWLENNHLELEKQTHKGIWVKGTELARRLAIFSLLRQVIGEKNWVGYANLIKANKAKGIKLELQLVEEFLNSLDLVFCRKLVDYIEQAAGNTMSNKSRGEIMLYLGIAGWQLSQGHGLEGDCRLENVPKSLSEITQIVGFEMEKHYKIHLNDVEFEMITVFLLSSKWTNTIFYSTEEEETELIPYRYYELAREFIAKCAPQLHFLLKIDEELIENIAAHLKSTIYRLEYRLPLFNSDVQEVKMRFPDVYRIAEVGARSVLEPVIECNIPDEEISFLTMYLASGLERLRTNLEQKKKVIVVTDGIRAKTALLKSRLNFEFPNLEIVKYVNNFDWKERLDQSTDLIISTIEIENVEFPWIQVTPFLTMAEIEKINNWITSEDARQRSKSIQKRDNSQNSVIDLLELSNISFSDFITDWQGIIKYSCAPLLKNNSISEEYIDAIIDYIKTYGMYMALAPGVLLLHAKPTDGVEKLCMSLSMRKEPIEFAESGQFFDVVFVLGTIDTHSHLKSLFELDKLLRVPGFLEELRAADSQAKVLRVIWRFLPKI